MIGKGKKIWLKLHETKRRFQCMIKSVFTDGRLEEEEEIEFTECFPPLSVVAIGGLKLIKPLQLIIYVLQDCLTISPSPILLTNHVTVLRPATCILGKIFLYQKYIIISGDS